MKIQKIKSKILKSASNQFQRNINSNLEPIFEDNLQIDFKIKLTPEILQRWT